MRNPGALDTKTGGSDRLKVAAQRVQDFRV